MTKTSLGHLPDGAWQFDEKVASCFEDMLMRSIPGFHVMRDLVTDVGVHHLREQKAEDGLVIDLGASTGLSILPFYYRLPNARFWAIESSPAMVAELRRKFGHSPSKVGDSRVRVIRHDLNTTPRRVVREEANLVTSILTLQFLMPATRLKVLTEAYHALKPGGALIVVEKVLASSIGMENDLEKLHHAYKRARGYTWQEIDRKKFSLQGVMVPVSVSKNEQDLRRAGFAEVECFWRALNFAGWMAVKSDPKAWYCGAV